MKSPFKKSIKQNKTTLSVNFKRASDEGRIFSAFNLNNKAQNQLYSLTNPIKKIPVI